MQACKSQKYMFVLYCILVGAGIFLLFNRVRYGVDFTDESWYVAEPYSVSQGAIPYVDNWSQAPGFSIPLFLAIKLYVAIRGGTEGIMLFARLLYVVWLLTILGCSFFFLNKNMQQKLPLILVLPLLFFCPYNLYDINYNTIGVWYLLLVAVIVLCSESANVRNNFLCGLIGGILIARAVIGTPAIMMPCFVLALMLFLKKDRIKFWGYFSGGCLASAMVIITCSVQGGGVIALLKGLNCLIKDGAYFRITSTHSAAECWVYLYDFLKPFLFSLIMLSLSSLFLKKKEQWYERVLFGVLLLMAGIGIYQGIHSPNDYISYTWFIGLFLFLFSDRKMRSVEVRRLFNMIILYISFWIFTSLTNIGKVMGREYCLFIPCILGYVMLYQTLKHKWIRNLALYLCIAGSTYIMVIYSYTYVYRDGQIRELNARIEQGIWKGCYTTEERKEAVEAIEAEIKEMTSEEDKVLFLDWASFGYLMSRGQACTPSVLDNMCYSYEINHPQIMYDYYNAKEIKPDKIIYVDFGRDSMLSIEDDGWGFNVFVNSFYDFAEEWQLRGYRLLLYTLKD